MVESDAHSVPLTYVGRYVLLREIGSGGMGVVYSAYDEELDRKLAIKVLRKELKGKGHAPLRIHREAQSLARLSHPNVVQVYDVGSFNGQLYIAMEFVEGESLKQWMPRHAGDWRACLAMFVAAGHGLAAAHAAGLIHRDFKPDNVLISRRDNRPRVLDFGLARPQEHPETRGVAFDTNSINQIVDTGSSLSDPLTRHGSLIGTPAYMSPEQHMRQPADARSDQFSFCVALYEALYGERPFPGKTQKKVAHSILRGKIRPPADHIRVPQWIRRILLRGLSADPDTRWPSMASLLNALNRDPTRLRWRVLMGAALLGVSAIGAYTLARQQLDPPDMRCSGAEDKLVGIWGPDESASIGRKFLDVSVPYAGETWSKVGPRLDAYAREWVQIHEDSCRATTIRQEQSKAMLDLQMACLGRNLLEFTSLTELFANADAQVIEHAVTSTAGLPSNRLCTDLERLQTRRQDSITDEDRDRVNQLRKKIAQASVYHASAKFEVAHALAGEAEATARELGYPGPLAAATYQQGKILEELGQFSEAQAAWLDAYWSAERAHDDETKLIAAIELIKLVGSLSADIDGGKHWARAAEATLDRLDEQGINRARFLDAVGALHFEAGERAQALEHHLAARTIMTRELREDDPELAWSSNNLGIVYQAQGDLVRAVEQFDTAIALLTVALGKHHPDLGIPLNNLGNALVTQGKVEAAREAFERVLEIRKQVYGPDHPSVGYSLNSIGNVFQKQGQVPEALARFEQAEAIWRRSFGEAHPNLGYAQINLGSVYLDQKQPERALAHFRRAQTIFSTAYGDAHVTLGYSLEGIGECELNLGNHREAVANLERALLVRIQAKTSPDELASTQATLARALLMLPKRDTERAKKLYQQAIENYRTAGSGFEDDLQDVAKQLAELSAVTP